MLLFAIVLFIFSAGILAGTKTGKEDFFFGGAVFLAAFVFIVGSFIIDDYFDPGTGERIHPEIISIADANPNKDNGFNIFHSEGIEKVNTGNTWDIHIVKNSDEQRLSIAPGKPGGWNIWGHYGGGDSDKDLFITAETYALLED